MVEYLAPRPDVTELLYFGLTMTALASPLTQIHLTWPDPEPEPVMDKNRRKHHVTPFIKTDTHSGGTLTLPSSNGMGECAGGEGSSIFPSPALAHRDLFVCS